MNCKEHAPEGGLRQIFQNSNAEKDVDETETVLHNLVSLLLTNTTIRSDADNTAEQNKFFKN
ncbi:hypothetical protein [Janthinobacterium sp. 17J80-10]|uniref:hypothetical protein n=1 Tax=Janthinobacterium sp. 17J80-10 TaxID=2497863 RepID=UPI0010053739|nr:hypothetical protein [Janthinobacterium sp. 17J80-10]QAU35780.1 hypothetical protein EKL02_17335 [Janthinobacterium sp. 17J80-10]